MIRITHGMSKTKIYRTYIAMKRRCKTNINYYSRNITVCDEWNKFENFYKDMGDVPKGKTLDRINNDKGYSKDNCRWATWSEQNKNRRPYSDIAKKNISLSLTGEKNPRAVITEEIAIKIKMLLNDKLKTVQISKQLNIPSYIVHNIKQGNAWNNINI